MNMEQELIENVKMYPVLFDPNEKEYRNKIFRNEAWEEIGQILDIPGNECKEMWMKIRNAYTNAMKRRKSKQSQGTKIMFKWKYEDQLAFLAQALDQRITPGNGEMTEEDLSEGEEFSQDETFSSSKPLASPVDHISPASPSLPLSAQSPPPLKKTRIVTSMSDMASLIKDNSCVRRKIASNNEIDMFFFSLSKTVQRLSPEEQARVKMDVSNLIFQAELRELQRLHTSDPNSLRPPNMSSQPNHLPSHSASSLSTSFHTMSSSTATNSRQNGI